jgi:hypothetical protein
VANDITGVGWIQIYSDILAAEPLAIDVVTINVTAHVFPLAKILTDKPVMAI